MSDKLFQADINGEDEAEKNEENLLEKDVIWHHGETVEEVVRSLSSSKGVRVDEAAKGLFQAIGNGRVVLVNPSPPRNFVSYFFSIYSLWFWSVILSDGLMFLMVLLIPQVYPYIYLRYFVSGAFVLFIPGYVLIEALYPGADELDQLERIALDVGLSLAAVTMIGLVLNYTPWKITLFPIIIILSILISSIGIFGTWRKYENLRMMPSLKEKNRE